jgi:hypothetical protein
MKVSHKKVKYHLASFAFASVLMLVAACSSDAFKPTGSKAIVLPGGSKSISKKTSEIVPEEVATKNADTGSSDVQNAKKPEPLVMNLTTNFAEGRQRKNVEQLKDAVLNCLGTEGSSSILNVKKEMLAIDPALLEKNGELASHGEGRSRFLLPNIYGDYVDKSILSAEESYLQIAATRTGLTADDIEDEIYLKSLVLVANVAAYNCDVKNVNSDCYCATKASAERMVNRCLPQFSPNSDEYKVAVEQLYAPENCGAELTSEEGFRKRRRAIAALLSSYAFATAK